MVIFGFSQGFLGQHSALSLSGTGLTENISPPFLSSSSSSSVMEEKKEKKENKEDKNENKDEKSKKRAIYYMPIL